MPTTSLCRHGWPSKWPISTGIPRSPWRARRLRPLGACGAGTSLQLPVDHKAIMSALMAGRHAMAHSSIMIRADVLRAVNGYWSLPFGEEYDLMLRIGEIAELANLDRVLLHYRVHQASMNGSGMQRMRNSVAYACELARRRQGGLPAISFDDYQAQREARPWWQRAAERIELYARCQYRLALAERYGGHRLLGSARLAWSAVCSPQLTVQRIARIAEARRPTLGRRTTTVNGRGHSGAFAERSI